MSGPYKETATTREDGTLVIDPPGPSAPQTSAPEPTSTASHAIVHRSTTIGAPVARANLESGQVPNPEPSLPGTLVTTSQAGSGSGHVPRSALSTRVEPAPVASGDSMDVDSMDEEEDQGHFHRADLSREQEVLIITKIVDLPSPDDDSYGQPGRSEDDQWKQFSCEFFEALERDIIPPGFGLTWKDLLDIVQAERWTEDDAVKTASKVAHYRMGRLIQKTECGDRGEIYTHIDDAKSRKELSVQQMLDIIDKISRREVETYATFSKAIELEIVPPDFGLSIQDLAIICHPSKWVQHDSEVQKKATLAFQMLQRIVEEIEMETKAIRGINKKSWIFHHRDADDTPPPSPAGVDDDQGLRLLHMEGHSAATETLKLLFQGFEAQLARPNSLSADQKEALRLADQHITEINKMITEFNDKNSLPHDLGVIYVDRLAGQWKAIFSRFPSEGRPFNEHQRHNLIRLCDNLHYPYGWKQVPPVEDRTYTPRAKYWSAVCKGFTRHLLEWYQRCIQEGSPSDQTLRMWADHFYEEFRLINVAYGQQKEQHIPDVESIAISLNKMANSMKRKDRSAFYKEYQYFQSNLEQGEYPMAWLPAEPGQEHWAKRGDGIPTELSQLTHKMASLTLAGRHAVIAVRPQRCIRIIKDGETSTGEKIRYIQSMGFNRANFVVEDAKGSYRLESSASAGGQHALNGAIRAKVPYTIQDKDIKALRDRFKEGGQFGLEFVAMAAWDLSTRENGTIRCLPQMVVGYFHHAACGNVAVGMSRTALHKLLTKPQAERLIVEVLGGSPHTPIREALLHAVRSKMEQSRGGFAVPSAYSQPVEHRQLFLQREPEICPKPRRHKALINAPQHSQGLEVKRSLRQKLRKSEQKKRALQVLSELLDTSSSDGENDDGPNTEEEY